LTELFKIKMWTFLEIESVVVVGGSDWQLVLWCAVVGAVWCQRADHSARGRVTQDYRRADEPLGPLWTHPGRHFHC